MVCWPQQLSGDQIMKKKNINSISDKIIFQQGLFIGLATFAFTLLINLLGGYLISSHTSLLGLALIISGGTSILAFVPSFFVALSILKRINVSSVNHVAATTVLGTYTLASLVTWGLPLYVAWYSLPLRIVSYVLAGGIAAILFNRLFKKIGAYDSANLVVFIMMALAFLTLSGILRFHL